MIHFLEIAVYVVGNNLPIIKEINLATKIGNFLENCLIAKKSFYCNNLCTFLFFIKTFSFEKINFLYFLLDC